VACKNVTVTLPYAISENQQHITKRWVKGVITRVPSDISDEEVKLETTAKMARRIFRMDGGDKIPTTAVIIAFEDELPKEVFVHFRRYKVNLYIPKPIRCNKCQTFGHRESSCESAITICSRCSSRHDYKDCPIDKSHAKCANCKQNHSAAYKGCIKYKIGNKSLVIATTQGISYRDATAQVKKSISEMNKPVTSIEQNNTTAANHVIMSSDHVKDSQPELQSTMQSVSANTGSSSLPSSSNIPKQTQRSQTLLQPTLSADQMRFMSAIAQALLWLITNIPDVDGKHQIITKLESTLSEFMPTCSQTHHSSPAVNGGVMEDHFLHIQNF